MELSQIVPWGRSLSEYKAMGLYTDADAHKKILGCGDGPASVNKELSDLGVAITSVDPLYAFNPAQITQRIDQTAQILGEQLKKNQHKFNWDFFKNPEEVVTHRLNTMAVFLNDYPQGLQEKRYLPQSLPKLDFPSDSFDLAWSSHFLFLYSIQLDYNFHLKAITQMLQLAKEVRIFPIRDLNNKISEHLDPLLEALTQTGITYQITHSAYEFQKNANECLRLYRK